MATREEKVILDIELKEDDIATRLGAIAEETSKLQSENQKLKKGLKDGTADWKNDAKAVKENEIQIKALKAAEKELTGQLSILTASNREYGDSNDAQRAQLGDLERQYNSLSQTQKDSSGGKALFKQLTDLKAVVKSNAEELGNYKDSVGDYKNQIVAANNSISSMKEQLKKLNSELEGMDIDSQEFKDTKDTIDRLSLAVDQAAGKVDEFGNREPKNIAKRQFEDTLVTVGILSSTIGGLSQAFSENENVQEALLKTQQALVLSQTVANVVKEKGAIIDTITLAKDKAMIGGKIALNAITRIFGVTSAQAWAMATLGISLLITGIILLIGNFSKIINAMKKFFGIADKFKDVKKDIEETANALSLFDERTNLIADRMAAEGKGEQEILNYKKKRFKDELALQKKLYSDIGKLGGKATDEQIEQRKAAAEFIRMSAFEQYKLDTEQIKLDVKLRGEAEKKRKEAADKKAESENVETEKSVEAKRKAAEDSIKVLDYELNLWKLKRKEANAKIKEDDDTAVINRITELDKEFTISTEKLRISLDNKLIAQSEYNSQLALLEQEKNTEIAIIEAEADAKRREEQKARDEKAAADKLAAVEKYEDAIEKAKESIASENEILELERQQTLLDAEYQAAIENALKIGANTELIDQEYALKRKQIFEATTAANLSNASDFAGNLATIFGESTKLGKAAAAAQVAIDTYKGAMAAYSAAASIPIVGQALGIAAAAAVTIKGTKAIKDIYAVKDSFSAGKFATGGIVGGRSYTGDAITARVNSGEMILNLQQQKKLFDTIAGGNVSASQGIDYDLLAKAMAKQPAPVIGMKEFLSFQEKIATFDEQIKI